MVTQGIHAVRVPQSRSVPWLFSFLILTLLWNGFQSKLMLVTIQALRVMLCPSWASSPVGKVCLVGVQTAVAERLSDRVWLFIVSHGENIYTTATATGWLTGFNLGSF
jgi:hypothetical protein